MKKLVFGTFLLTLSLPLLAEASRFKPGDELYTRRRIGKATIYHHSGVYVGNGQVVHANSTPGRALKRLLKGTTIVKIEKTGMAAFSEGHSVKLGPTKRRFSRAQVVKRALARVGSSFHYNPLKRNCQHFSSKIVSGNARSPEAHKLQRVFRNMKKAAAKKVKHALTGKNNVWAKIKNCSSKKVYVCVYNGGDKARVAAKKRLSIHRGRTATIRCASNGKGRCRVKLSKKKKCSLFLKTYSAPKSKTRYVRYKKGKFRLHSSCR